MSELKEIKEIEKRWLKKWEEAKLFEPKIDENKPKFFANFPYPYLNGYPHIGHTYTASRVDAFVRYKRLKGFNALFPQGWHATGSPIASAVKRLKEGEPNQIKIMKGMGFSDKEIDKFKEPKHWIEFFAPKYKKSFKELGYSIDWRREFYTTSLNPRYDKFIRWQFRKLKEKGYVIKGKFPVVWCPKCNNAVSDHSRTEGEGERPQEFVLIKMKLEDSDEYIVVATLRPETMFGQTNVWIGPDTKYVKANVDGEKWIMSLECAKKLEQQDHKIDIVSEIDGKELIGKRAKAPFVNRYIPIWPSDFCDPKKGSGIVTSVPSDAPDDYMGLKDLKESAELREKYGLKKEEIDKIEPIPIIDSDELGDLPAKKVCEEMGIKNQHERKKLEQAKKFVYKKGFYLGKMKDNCGKFSGKPVEIAKEKMKKELLKNNDAIRFYELSGKVVCRCLTPAIVKIVHDQWFIDYANEEWKKKTRECLNNLKLYPEKVRGQFEYVIEWLHEWACTREEGLGTRLPWDEKWLIESLSDSTLYMAYYTIAHILKEINPEDIDDNLFDYVFLGKNIEIKADKKKADAMREEFNYWYGVDFRNSAKDLVQNHLSFFLFNHTAIFPKDKWPQGMGVNGYLTIDGAKMSKSKGNFLLIKDLLENYPADVTRATLLSGGEEMDDPNWDTEFAESLLAKFPQWIKYIVSIYNKGREERKKIDDWMESRLYDTIKDVSDAMENTLFRTAFHNTFFQLSNHLRWYLRRCKNNPNKKIINKVIESQLIMLSPITPFLCEEAWKGIGKKGFISKTEWPEIKAAKLKKDAEWLVKNLLEDIRNVSELAKLDKIKRIRIFFAEDWKYRLFDLVEQELKETDNPKQIIQKVMQTDLKKHGKEIIKFLPKILQKRALPSFLDKETEEEAIRDAKGFLEEEFNSEIIIHQNPEKDMPKSKQAMPGKPAILLE